MSGEDLYMPGREVFVRARGGYYERAERGLALRAREQGRDPGLERSHRARKVYELRRFPVHPWGQVQDLPVVEPGQQGDRGTVEEGVGFEPSGSGGGSGDSGNSSGEGSSSEAAGERRIKESGLVATVLRRRTAGAERAARRERRGGEGGERNNKEVAGPARPVQGAGGQS